MTKQEKINSLLKYIEVIKRNIDKEKGPLRAFFEREIKRSEKKINELR